MNYLYKEWKSGNNYRHIDIRRLLKEHYEPYYDSKFKNLEEIDKFLQTMQTTRSYTRK